MNLALIIASSRRESINPDALAYISMVQASGVNDTHLATLGMPAWSVISPAIHAWYRSEQASDRWNLIKRFYLPIWGNAVANAICLKTRSSGTFYGTVISGRGFVKSDGSTGCFGFGVSASELGMSQFNTGYVGAGVVAGGNRFFVGRANYTTGDASLLTTGDGPTAVNFYCQSRWDNKGRILQAYNRQGILSANSRAGRFQLYARTPSARNVLADVEKAGLGSTPTLEILALYDPSYTLQAARTVDTFFYGAHHAMTDSQDFAYTLGLKTLWETCVGRGIY